jgi:hypothetical protein
LQEQQKNLRKQPRTVVAAVRSVLRKDLRREIQFRSDEESAEKAKEFQPLDFAQRTDSRRIREKVHEV